MRPAGPGVQQAVESSPASSRADSLAKRLELAVRAFLGPKPRKFELGVLFVHGMGEQARGDTLTEAGDALVQWLERWCERPPDGTRLKKGDVHVLDASLRTAHSDELETAHLTLRLTLPLDADHPSGKPEKVVHWILAESWWAEGFRPATFNQLVGWVLGIGPWVLATQFQGIRNRTGMPAGSPWPLKMLLWPAAILTLGAMVAAAVLLGLVLTVVSLLVLLLRLIPIGPLQSLAGGIQRSLASSFGDLMILVQSPSRFGAMRSQVRGDVDALTRSCEKVVVIAHSQGSHIAWEAIRRPTPDSDRVPANLVRLFTYGQAMRKLKFAYEVSRHELNGGIGLVVLAAVAAQLALGLLTVAALSVAFDGGALVDRSVAWLAGWTPLEGPLLLGLLLATVVGGNAVLLRRARTEMDAVERKVADAVRNATENRKGFRWIDLWSSADPAPNGPLSVEPIDQVESWRVRNAGSILFDHSIYWQNVTEFIGAIAGELGRIGAGTAHFPRDEDPFPSRRLKLAALTRGARVQVLTALRVMWIGAVLAFGLLAFPAVLSWIDLGWLPDDVPVIGLLGDWGPPIIAMLIIGAGGLAGWIAIAKLWGAGIRADDRAYFAGGIEGPFPWPSWGALLLLIFLVPAVSLGLWYPADAPVLAATYALLVLPIAMAANTFLSGGGRGLAETSRAERLSLTAVPFAAAIVLAAVLLAPGIAGAFRPGDGASGAWAAGAVVYLAVALPLAWATLRRWRGFLRAHRALRDPMAGPAP